MTKRMFHVVSAINSIFVILLIFAQGISITTSAKPNAKAAYQLSGKVISCHDGDTCRVAVKGKEVKVRFAGIDTPELKQSYGQDARRFTETLIKDKNVELQCVGNSFDRITCEVFLGKISINEELVKNGWAWDSPKFSKNKYATVMNEARIAKKGIWSQAPLEQIISPFCYRHKDSNKCRVNKSYME